MKAAGRHCWLQLDSGCQGGRAISAVIAEDVSNGSGFGSVSSHVERFRMLTYSWQAFNQLGQCRLDGVPNNVEVDVEIAMRNAVSHPLHTLPGDVWMLVQKRGEVLQKFRGCLADDHDIQDHGLLGPPVGEEVFFVQPFNVAAGLLCGFQHMAEVVSETAVGHTGMASARTFARNLGGKSPGVKRSTGTPSSSSSSICRPPRSNSVAPGCGSTSRSRSLSSVSLPCRTDPNTRGLEARKRWAASRTASRWLTRAMDGFTATL